MTNLTLFLYNEADFSLEALGKINRTHSNTKITSQRTQMVVEYFAIAKPNIISLIVVVALVGIVIIGAKFCYQALDKQIQITISVSRSSVFVSLCTSVPMKITPQCFIKPIGPEILTMRWFRGDNI